MLLILLVILFLLLLIPKTDLGSEGYGDLLACIRDKKIHLQNIHFVVGNQKDKSIHFVVMHTF